MDDIQRTLDKVIWRVDTHEGAIRDLRQNANELRERLDDISSTLLQIKFISIGIGLVYFAEQLGFADILKTLAL